LWRFDPGDLSWKILHHESFDFPARNPIGDSVPITGIRLTPEIQSAGDIAEVWWESQGWVRRFRLSNEDGLTETQPIPPDRDWSFLSWQRSKEGLLALVEDSDGQRRLVRAVQDSSDRWEPVTAPSNSNRISGFTVFDGFVYVTVDDAQRGFGLKTLPPGESPAKAESWQPVLGFGAFRYLLNANVLEIVSCPDALYLAVGLKKALPADQSIGILARQGFELLRVYPDQEGWDIMIGQPRFTSDGLKVPLSGRGAGFDERDPLRFVSLVNVGSGLHLGLVDNQLAQLWKLDGIDQWQELCHGAFLGYQRARLSAALPTPHGILLVTECLDFGGNDSLELWMVLQKAG
jgi:hypothetical protein